MNEKTITYNSTELLYSTAHANLTKVRKRKLTPAMFFSKTKLLLAT